MFVALACLAFFVFGGCTGFFVGGLCANASDNNSQFFGLPNQSSYEAGRPVLH
jgi:hypothetical protein